jgi:hypothetical protein
VDAPLALEGVPRELGYAQGRAARTSIRRACAGAGPVAETLARFGVLPRERARWLRDVRRHFPHQAEWLEGAARGAGVSLGSLVRAAADALSARDGAWSAADGTLSALDGTLLALARPGGAWLARGVASDAVLRRVAPEGRFRSLELARPLLPAPDLGVNEAGLAVAVRSGAAADPRCAAPAALLARDCLERFDSVSSALDWCLGRPAAPGAALLFADASGRLAGVLLAAHERRVLRPENGVLALGVDESALGALRARRAEPAAPDLSAALGVAPGGYALADPARRALQLAGGAVVSLDSGGAESATANAAGGA